MYRTNASVNREHAMRLIEAGVTPEEIAAEWPRVWRCVGGKLAQRYDVLVTHDLQRSGVLPAGQKETRLVMLYVDEFLEARKANK